MAKAKVDRPYWLLIEKKGGPDPRKITIVDFSRHPYDSTRNAWCFTNSLDRALMRSQHGGQEHNVHIKQGEK